MSVKLKPEQPLMLHTSQYKNMWSIINGNKEKEEISKQEQVFHEYLQQTSEAMTKTWENSIENTRKLKDLQKAEIKKNCTIKDQQYVKQLAKIDEVKRQEIIQKAEKLIEKNKPGPRQLESAALLSEVLKERDLQIQFRTHQKQRQKEQDKRISEQILRQAKQWVEKTLQRQIEDKKRNDSYKKEVQNFVKEQISNRTEIRKLEINQERLLNDLASNQTVLQNEQNKLFERRKKGEFKKNMIEAMEMKKDKLKQQKVEEDVELSMIDAYVKGKEEIVLHKRSRQRALQNYTDDLRKVVAEQYDKIQKEVDIRNSLEDSKIRFSKASVDMQIIEKREAERKQKAGEIKAMRCQQQIEALERTLEKKKMFDDERKLESVNEKRNKIVTLTQKNQKIENTKNSVKQIREALGNQVEEKLIKKKIDFEMDVKLKSMNYKNHIEDDKNFYIYANNLLVDAKDKGRPTLCLKRAVDAYQRNNLLKYTEKDNRDFLFSKVPIGLTNSDRSPLPQPIDLIEKYKLIELTDLNPYKSRSSNNAK